MVPQLIPEKEEGPKVPPVIYAEASVCSTGGTSLFDAPPVTSQTVGQFYSEPDLISLAVEKLKAQGFDVLAINPITISIAAPPSVYEKTFKTKIVAKEQEAVKEFGRVTTATFLDSPDTEMPQLVDTTKSPLKDVLEGVALNRRVYYMASASPPAKSYWHLEVPAGVSRALKAEDAHQSGVTGKGIKVVMVDTGWYRHPFFAEHGYTANPVVIAAGATEPDHDKVGHGTAESSNVFAVAPDVEFTMVKQSDVNETAGFKAAVNLRPHVISCSWGYDIAPPYGQLDAATQTLAAAIADAVKSGIIVVFSAGNGHFAFPGCHPDVIAAGGVYMDRRGSLKATPYASAFTSHLYPGRNVPDLCG
ncbi:MAG: S8 family serine peptidase, partial [Halobacteriota archaeon]